MFAHPQNLMEGSFFPAVQHLRINLPAIICEATKYVSDNVFMVFLDPFKAFFLIYGCNIMNRACVSEWTGLNQRSWGRRAGSSPYVSLLIRQLVRLRSSTLRPEKVKDRQHCASILVSTTSGEPQERTRQLTACLHRHLFTTQIAKLLRRGL